MSWQIYWRIRACTLYSNVGVVKKVKPTVFWPHRLYVHVHFMSSLQIWRFEVWIQPCRCPNQLPGSLLLILSKVFGTVAAVIVSRMLGFDNSCLRMKSIPSCYTFCFGTPPQMFQVPKSHCPVKEWTKCKYILTAP